MKNTDVWSTRTCELCLAKNREGGPPTRARGLPMLLVATGSLLGHAAWSQSFPARLDFPLTNGDSSEEVVAVDLNGDGLPEIVAGAQSQGVAVLPNLGAGNFEAAQVTPLPGGPLMIVRGITAADFDGDGDADVAASNRGGFEVWILRNVGGSLVHVQTVNPGPNFGYQSVRAGDLDGDGDQDLVTPNETSGPDGDTLFFLANDGSGFFTVASSIGFPPPPNRSILYALPADVDADGDADVVFAFEPKVAVVLNDGTGAFGAPIPFTIGPHNGTQQIAIADLDGDGFLDVATANSGATSLSVLRNLGTTGGTWNGLAPSIDFSTGGSAIGIAAADFDVDGDPDLAISLEDLDEARLYLNNGSGGFSEGPILPTPTIPERLAAGDLDGDGTPDILGSRQDPADPNPNRTAVFAYLNQTRVPTLASLHPRTLNLSSNGNFVTCYLNTLDGSPITSLVPSSPTVVAVDGAPVAPVQAVQWDFQDQDGDGTEETLMAKFDRGQIAALLSPGVRTLTVRASSASGRVFEGSDTIRAQ